MSLFFPKGRRGGNQTLSSGLYRLSLPTKGVGIPFCRSGFQFQICASSRVPESEATLSGARLLQSVHLGEEMLILTAGIIFPREGMLLHNVAYGIERVGCPRTCPLDFLKLITHNKFPPKWYQDLQQSQEDQDHVKLKLQAPLDKCLRQWQLSCCYFLHLMKQFFSQAFTIDSLKPSSSKVIQSGHMVLMNTSSNMLSCSEIKFVHLQWAHTPWLC